MNAAHFLAVRVPYDVVTLFLPRPLRPLAAIVVERQRAQALTQRLLQRERPVVLAQEIAHRFVGQAFRRAAEIT